MSSQQTFLLSCRSSFLCRLPFCTICLLRAVTCAQPPSGAASFAAQQQAISARYAGRDTVLPQLGIVLDRARQFALHVLNTILELHGPAIKAPSRALRMALASILPEPSSTLTLSREIPFPAPSKPVK